MGNKRLNEIVDNIILVILLFVPFVILIIIESVCILISKVTGKQISALK